MSWARLLKRVFDIDIEQCSQCSGILKIIAAIVDPIVIAKILVCCFFMNVHYLVGLWVCGHQGWMSHTHNLVRPEIVSGACIC